ncbi:MAG: hypothetical protein C0597_14510 [Marinilabiliales bacterium]|nr:MAG: hypothetical protein C0597_14510 [Marinilabiliales bacterium]
MNNNKYFSLKRFSRLLKKEAHINIKRDLLIIVAMYSLYTIVMALVFEFGEGDYSKEVIENLHFVTFTVMFFTAGYFITSFSFIELRDKMKSHFYLLTPGSNFEKFTVNLFISFIAYILFMIISYYLYSQTFNWLVFKIYNIQFSPLDLLSDEFGIVINIFIIAHSIFLLGSLSFKKFPILFTPIACVVIIIILSFYNELVEKIVFAGMDINDKISDLDFNNFFARYKLFAKAISFYVFPIILWFTAYIKLNEKEY